MDIQDIRRARLQAMVNAEGLSVVAKRFNKPDRQINDMLQKRKSFGEKIARQMERGHKPTSLPDRYFDNDDKTITLNIEDRELLERDYGMGKGYLDAHPSSELEEAPLLLQFRNVPIVGSVQGGDNGYLLELEYPPGHGDGSITYPAKNQNTYALRVRGDSMRPRIKDGEFVVVDPEYQAIPGDEIIVCLKNGKKMVKEYLYKRNDTITLGSINNGHTNITVELKDIEKMHYVAAIIPRGSYFHKLLY